MGYEAHVWLVDAHAEGHRCNHHHLFGRDKVMLILKRRIEFWFCLLGLHKIGAIAVPATHLLTPKDLVYRNKAASIKMVVAVGEEECLRHVQEAKSESPELKGLVSVGPLGPEGWKAFSEGRENSPAFVRPAFVNNNDDISLLYFTSGTSGQPKMVAHDFVYPLGHIITAKYWHNLHPDSLHLTIADTGWAKAVWGKFYGQWICGACVFVYDHEKFSGAAILSMIERHKITSLCAPPTIFRFLIREALTKYDFSSLEYLSLIHISEPTRPNSISYAVFCLKKKNFELFGLGGMLLNNLHLVAVTVDQLLGFDMKLPHRQDLLLGDLVSALDELAVCFLRLAP